MKENEIQILLSLNKLVKSLIDGQALTGDLSTLSENVPGPLKDLIGNLDILTQKLQESQDFTLALASGKLDYTPPQRNNIISPFKQLHSNMLHLTWQAQQIARGDYNQKVSFMGDFSLAFNKMIESLKEKKILEDKLIESNATKDKLFSIIAHDLKSPFNTIFGFTDLLIENYDEFSEEKRKYFINFIDKSSKSAFQLLDNLLLWAMSQRDRIIIEMEKTNLKQLIVEAVTPYIISTKKKGITFSNSVSDSIGIIVDKQTIKTVLGNLFNNAVKFTPNNGHIAINATIDTGFVKIEIKDNGVGIPKNIQSNIFKIDKSRSTLGTDKEKGTGLGLSLCKEFVEKNGGAIWVESEVGKGSKFMFTVPYDTKTDKEIETNIETTKGINNEKVFENMIILITEDDEFSIVFFEVIVEGVFGKVFYAKTGNQAVEICTNHPEIDIVLMDIRMPVMDGYGATREIRKFNKDLIIIAQTAFTQVGEKEKALKAGCDDYISKPIRKEELLEMINYHIKKKQLN